LEEEEEETRFLFELNVLSEITVQSLHFMGEKLRPREAQKSCPKL
jgi:hypothetical protein